MEVILSSASQSKEELRDASQKDHSSAGPSRDPAGTLESRMQSLEAENVKLRLKIKQLEQEMDRLRTSEQEPEADTISLINKLPTECLESIFKLLDPGTQRKCREVCTLWDQEIQRIQISAGLVLTLPEQTQRISLLSSELNNILKKSTSNSYGNLNVSNLYLKNDDFLRLLREHGCKVRTLSIYHEDEEDVPANIIPFIIRHCPQLEELEVKCDLTDFDEVDEAFPASTQLTKLGIYRFNEDAQESNDPDSITFQVAELFGNLVAVSPNITDLVLADPNGIGTGQLLPRIRALLPHVTPKLSTLQFNGTWIGRAHVDGLTEFRSCHFPHLIELIISDKEGEGQNEDTLNLALRKVSNTLKSLTIEDGIDWVQTEGRLDFPVLPNVTTFKYIGYNARRTNLASLSTGLPNLQKLVYRSPSYLFTSDRILPRPFTQLREIWSAQPFPHHVNLSTLNTNFPNLSKLLITLRRPNPYDTNPHVQPADYYRNTITSLTALRQLKQLYLKFPEGHPNILHAPAQELRQALGSLSLLTSVERLTIGSTTRLVHWLNDAFLRMPNLRVVTLVGHHMSEDDPPILRPLWDRNVQIRFRDAISDDELFAVGKSVKSW